MRSWGITFTATAAGAALLPVPVAFILFGVVTFAGMCALGAEYAERCRARDAAQRAATDRHRLWLAELRSTDAEHEAQWEEICGVLGIGGNPVRQQIPVVPLTLVTPHVPAQRGPGGAA